MRIYYITAKNGDGSSRTEFYDSKECIDYLTDDDLCIEDYMDGDGGSWGFFEAPGEITFDSHWKKVETIEDVKARYE